MRRLMICAVALVVCSISTPAPSQEDGSTATAVAKGTSASGLEIAVIKISEATRRDEFGQALVRMGSCPPGVAPAGMEDLMLIIPGKGAVVQLRITATAQYVANDLSGPPVAIDVDGKRYQPRMPFFLPDLDALKSLTSSGEALNCEFPFDVDAGHVRAIEFAGVRLNVLPE